MLDGRVDGRQAGRSSSIISASIALADPVLLLVGVVVEVVELVAVDDARRPAQNGSMSPGSNGWRITGHVEPGMRSSAARSSGRRQAQLGEPCTGIVDQRFDHIDSGTVVARRARGRTCGARR